MCIRDRWMRLARGPLTAPGRCFPAPPNAPCAMRTPPARGLRALPRGSLPRCRWPLGGHCRLNRCASGSLR
eukprot:5367975-Alexandrium_andersonii.AAC.1